MYGEPHAKFHVYWGNMLPLRGKKPIFGLPSKNNTSMAALHTGLPVISVILRELTALNLSKSDGVICKFQHCCRIQT